MGAFSFQTVMCFDIWLTFGFGLYSIIRCRQQKRSYFVKEKFLFLGAQVDFKSSERTVLEKKLLHQMHHICLL